MIKNIEMKKKIERQVEEFLKCKNDFKYFIFNYVYIATPGGDKLIRPYDKQLELLDLINLYHYIIVLKSRQIGISTIIQAYVAWLTVFHDNVNVGIVSKNGSAATKFSRFIMSFIDKLPDWMRPKFNKRNERSFELKNGSCCTNTPVDPKMPENCLRSEAVTFLVLDEAAFTQKLDAAWTSMVSTLSTNQMQARLANVPFGTVILSTPNKTTGVGKFFYSRYLKATSGDYILKPFIIHWKMIPELSSDPFWYKSQCALFDNDPRRIQQELELKFLPTEGSFFDEKTNVILQENPRDPIEIQKIFNGEIRVYSRPIPGRYYLIGVDTATKNGEDKSAIVVLDYLTMEQVWEYQAKCEVIDFCKIVEVACVTYPGSLIVENNSVGNQVVESLNRSNYHTMLYKGKLIGNGANKNPTSVPGLPVNSYTRPLIIDALYSNVSNYPYMIKSKTLALELIGLVSKKNGKIEADTDCHDDLAMALSFCHYIKKYDPPLMIDFKGTEQSIDFNNILSLNDGVSNDIINNGTIIRNIKNRFEINDYENLGWINILDFYNE